MITLLFPMALVCIAAVTDFRDGKIKNLLCVAMAGSGLIANLFLGLFPSGFTPICATHALPMDWLEALVGLGGMLLAGIAMMLFAGFGAGDAKLLAALGAWFGLSAGVLIACVGLVLAGTWSAVWLVLLRGRMAGAACPDSDDPSSPHPDGLPLAPFFAASTLIFICDSVFGAAR